MTIVVGIGVMVVIAIVLLNRTSCCYSYKSDFC